METTIASEIQNDPALIPVVTAGNEVLLKLFGRVQDPPRAVWRLVRQDGKPPAVELELSDQQDSVSRQFALEEFANPRELRFKLSTQWGDLIMRAYRESTERLLSALRELRKEEEIREAQLQGA